jgi:hypothetical protein
MKNKISKRSKVKTAAKIIAKSPLIQQMPYKG